MRLHDLEKDYQASIGADPFSLDSLEANFQSIEPMTPIPFGGPEPPAPKSAYTPTAPITYEKPPTIEPIQPIQPEKTFLQKAIPAASNLFGVWSPFIQAQLFMVTGEDPYHDEAGFVKKSMGLEEYKGVKALREGYKGVVSNVKKSLGLEEYEGIKALKEGYKGVASGVSRGVQLITQPYEQMPDVKDYDLEDPIQRTEYSKELHKAWRGGAGTPEVVSDAFRQLSDLDSLQPDLDYYERLEKKGTFTKYLEGVTGMAPQMATQIAAHAAAGRVGSGIWMALQIAGQEYDGMIREGADPRRAAAAAWQSAMLQAPMEALSLGWVLKNPITSKFVKGGLVKFGLDRVLGGMTEFITETVQNVPSSFWNEWAKDPKLVEKIQKDPKVLQELVVKALDEGLEEGAIGAFYGVLLGGAGPVTKPKIEKPPVKEPKIEEKEAEIVPRETFKPGEQEIIKSIRESFQAGDLTADDLRSMQGEIKKDHPLYGQIDEILSAEKPPPIPKKKPEVIKPTEIKAGERLDEFEKLVQKKLSLKEQPEITLAQPKGAQGVKTVGRALGLDVVFFRGEGKANLLNGAMQKKTGTIFINENTSKPYLSVLGHESVHNLKKNYKDLYENFVNETQAVEIGFDKYLEKLNKDRARGDLEALSLKEALAKEEFIGDFVGQQFINPDFWEKLNKQNPTLGRQLAEIISEIIEKVKTAIRKSPSLKRQYFTDLNKAQDALAKTYAEFARKAKEVEDVTVTEVKPKKKPELEVKKGRAGAIEYDYKISYEAQKQYPGVKPKDLVALQVWDKPGDAGKQLAVRYATRDNVDEMSEKAKKEFPDAWVTHNYDLTPYSPRKGEISFKEYSAERDKGVETPEIAPPERVAEAKKKKEAKKAEKPAELEGGPRVAPVRKGPIIEKPIEKVSPAPIRPPSKRWQTDRGAMPGEPSMFLDSETAEEAKAVIIEREDDQGNVLYEVRDNKAKLLGSFATVERAANIAEEVFPVEKKKEHKYFEDLPKAEQEKAIQDYKDAIKVLEKRKYPFEAEDSTGEKFTVLGSINEFEPYKKDKKDFTQLMVENENGKRSIRLVGDVFEDGKPIIPKTLPRKKKGFVETIEKTIEEAKAKKLTKKEKSLAAYNKYIDGLSEQDRKDAAHLIEEKPDKPSLTELKIQKFLAARKAKKPAIPEKPAEKPAEVPPKPGAKRKPEDVFVLETDMPLYDNILKNPEYHLKEKGMKATIEWISPDEYLKRQAEVKGVSLKQDLKVVDRPTVEKIKKSMETGERKINMLSLEPEPKYQEGKHRAVAAKEYGLDKVPVVIIERVKKPEKVKRKADLSQLDILSSRIKRAKQLNINTEKLEQRVAEYAQKGPDEVDPKTVLKVINMAIAEAEKVPQKPATIEEIKKAEEDYEKDRKQAVEQVGEDVTKATEIEADANQPAKTKPYKKPEVTEKPVKFPKKRKWSNPVFIHPESGKEYTCYGHGVHLVGTGPNKLGGTGWEWYALEPIKEDTVFGFVHGFEDEFGSFSMSELRENGVIFTTKISDLRSIAPPVGWTKKTAEAKPAKPEVTPTEKTPIEELKSDLDKKGAARIGNVDFKILQVPDTEDAYFYQKTEEGIRYKEGGAGLNLWSRETAIEKAAQEAEKFLTKPEKEVTIEISEKPLEEQTADDLLGEWDKQAAELEPTETETLKPPKADDAEAKATKYLNQINDILEDDIETSIKEVDVDQKKWEKIQPLLKSAWDEMSAAGKTGKDFVQLAIKVLSPNGKPYFEKFVREEIGKEKPSERLREEAPKTPKGEPAEDVTGVGEERPVGELPGRRGEPGEKPEDQAIEERPPRVRGTGVRERDTVSTERRRSSGDRPGRYRITAADNLESGGIVTKYEQNVKAIKLLKQIEEENRKATPQEQEVLVKYTGWGGIAQAFDRFNKDWSDRVEQLDELLTEDEYRSAKASTPNAHYTSPDVINFIYNSIDKMGFKGGRVLEPATGTGHFFGMLPDKYANSTKLTGVELDSIPARIAGQLYQDADIRNTGYQDAKIPDNYFDLIVSNVPFADVRPYDRKYKAYRFQLHDYYFAKSLDKVRPGGMVAFITSKGTMDKKDKILRKYIAERAELVAAVRLPSDAFKKIAHTEVTTDVLFLRRYKEGEKPKEATWIDTKPIEIEEGVEAPVNQYFIDNPEMVQGEFYRDKLVGGIRSGVKSDGRDLVESLNKIVETKINEEVFDPDADMQPEVEENLAEMIPAPEDIKEYQFFKKDNKFYQLDAGETVEVAIPKQHRVRMGGLIGLRDSIRQLFRNQLAGETASFKSDLKDLNRQYDDFVKRYGPINEGNINGDLFSEDPEWSRLLALEKLEDKKWVKEAVFSKRTIERYEPISKADSPEQAYIASMVDLGKVDWPYISGLLGITEEKAQDKLYGQVYLDPERGWVPSDEYLSGNVKAKLDAAIAAVETEQDENLRARFIKNVEALQKAQPVELKPSEISAKLGAPWIPAETVQEFIAETLEAREFKVRFVPETNNWKIEKSKVSYAPYSENFALADKWGTNRRPALFIINAALNKQQPKVFDTIREDGKERKFLNRKETLLVALKIEQVNKEFEKWLWRETDRREAHAALYNNIYNNIQLRKFDGSHLPDRLPGMSPLALRRLRPHQKNAIWRILQGGNVLLDHKVGSGKTYTMIGAAMELKRMGMAKKPLVVVPKSIVEQFSEDFRRLYPSARILHATLKQDKAQRNKMMARITTGNWDAVIVTQSQFELLPMSKEAQKKYIEDQIDALEAAIQREIAVDAELGMKRKRSQTVKQIEKAKERLESKLKEILDAPKDETLTFEELGVDYMFVDEAHHYKNLFFTSKMTRIPGVGANKYVKKTGDMELKTSYLGKLNNGRGIIFSTGTPISNSISEMWVMTKYLSEKQLHDYELKNFDAWASTFGDLVVDYEIDPTGAGFRQHTRFRSFSNLTELQNLYRSFTDVVLQKDIEGYIKIPKVKGGKANIITIEASQEQRSYVQHLVERVEAVRSGQVDPREDNFLKITVDGKKAALDGRLVGVGPGKKLNEVSKNVFKEYQSNPDGTQLVFMDMSTPSKKQWDAYNALKELLVERGVKENEIAFIYEAGNSDVKREALFKRVRKGEIKIIMGSTGKMGEGVNIQDKVVAIHHVDAPYKPAEIEQRNGRAFRQGNENDEVSEYRYVTTGTFDAYMWQLLEFKANFIEQIKRYGVGRSAEGDIGTAVLSYGEVKALASENPLVFEMFKTRSELAKLEMEYSGWKDQQFDAQKEIGRLPNLISQEEGREKAIKDAIDTREKNPISEDAEIEIEIDGTTYTTRKEARAALLEQVKKAWKTKDTEIPLATYRGIKIVAENVPYKNKYFQELQIKEDKDKRTVEIYWGDLAEWNFVNEIEEIKSYSDEAKASSVYLTKILAPIETDQHMSFDNQHKITVDNLKYLKSSLKKYQEFPAEFEKQKQLDELRFKMEELVAKIDGKQPGAEEGEISEDAFYMRVNNPDATMKRFPGAREATGGGWWIPEFNAEEVREVELVLHGTWFIHPDNDQWAISDAITGAQAVRKPTKEGAINTLKDFLKISGNIEKIEKARKEKDMSPWAESKDLKLSLKEIPDFEDTNQAIEFGEKIKQSPAAISHLRELREKALNRSKELMEKDDFNNAMIWATKAQLYREAVETAEGTINLPGMPDDLQLSVKKASPIAQEYIKALRLAQPNAFVKNKIPLPEKDIEADIYPDDPEVKERMQVAKGVATPKFKTKAGKALRETWWSMTRHRPFLDPKEMANVANVLRLHQEVPQNSARKALKIIENLVGGMKPKQYEAFSYKLIIDDMIKDVDSGLLTGEQGYPFGFKSEDDIRAYQDKITAIAEADPLVKDALRRRNQFNNGIKKVLVRLDLLPESVLKDDRYFHHQVLEYQALKAMGEAYPGIGLGSKDVRLKRKGWQIGRKGSIKDYNTEYAEAEFEVIAQAIAQIETKMTLNRLRKMVDITPGLKLTFKNEKKLAEIEGREPKWESWKDIPLPKGIVPWKPAPGKSWYKAHTITDRMVEAIQAGEEVLGAENIDQIKTALAKGRDVEWLIPEGLAKTLDGFDIKLEDHIISNASRQVMNAWKKWILINPYRVVKYNLNNMSGDFDIAFAYDPKITTRYMGAAVKDLARKNKSPELEAELEDAFRQGILGSGWSVQEVEAVTAELGYNKQIEALKGEKPNLITRGWRNLSGFTAYRENILRLASYRYFKDRIVKGGEKGVYAASNKKEVDGIPNPKERAAKLARELIGDYGNITHAGQWLRRHALPFYAWMEINAPRYVRLIANVRHEGQGAKKIGRMVPMAGARIAWKGTKLAVKATAIFALVNLYNHTFFPDEEEELGEWQRRQLHLILGRRKDGSIITLRFQGALSDALAWFGGEDIVDDVRDVIKGKKSITEYAKETALAAPIKIINAIRPDVKMFAELGASVQLYPDPFNPRPLRDKLEHIARVFSLDAMYRYLAGKPRRGDNISGQLLNDILRLGTYTADPGESAYYDIISQVYDYKSKVLGKEPPTIIPTSKSNALYYYKQALKYGDLRAANKYLDLYINKYKGTMKGLKLSIKRSHPLGSLAKKDWMKFINTLSPQEKERYKIALAWYNQTYKGGKQPIQMKLPNQ